jgi:hypothetical protein
MSVVNDPDASGTHKQRGEAAVRRVAQAVGLTNVTARQLPLLTAELAVAACEELAHNPTFLNHIRAAFERTLEHTAQAGNAGRQLRTAAPKIVPIKYVDPARFATYGPSDPYALFEQYGEKQLPLVLKKFLMADLTKSAALVQARNPGAQLRPKAKKDEVIGFIVRYITGQH